LLRFGFNFFGIHKGERGGDHEGRSNHTFEPAACWPYYPPILAISLSYALCS
jgi:hypothetical protein